MGNPDFKRNIAELRALIGSGGGSSPSDATPAAVGTAAAGVSSTVSRSDHVHAHGNQTSGTLHAAATTSTAGFMSTTQVTAHNRVVAGCNFVNVKDAAFGAVGDGVTYDTSAINTALGTLSATSGVCYIPPGTYQLGVNGIVFSGIPSGTTIRGLNANVSILRAGSTIVSYMMQGGTYLQNLTFEDLTFDGGNYSAGVLTMLGSVFGQVTFRRCRIQNINRFVLASAVTGLTIEDCWTHGGNVDARTAIFLDSGCRNIKIRRNSFLYWNNAIIGNTASGTSAEEEMIEDVEVSENHFDGAWTMRPSYKTNSGGTVTYSATDLTDSAGGFNAAAVATSNTIRALTVERSSTFTTVSQTRFTNTGATFVTGAVYRGDIIRSGTKWAFISGVESETALGIEGWLDSTTYLPVAPPSVGGSFTVYKLHIGQVTFRTDTVLSVARWFRTNGATSIPASGTLYEICTHSTYSGMHFEYGAKNVVIDRNTVLRSWGDCISYYGNRGRITNNTVRDGQDVGITVNGALTDGHNYIAGNTCIHAGSMNIWIGSSRDNHVTKNRCIAGCWTTDLGFAFGAGIVVQGSSDNVIEHNLIDGENLPNSNFGICLAGDSNADCNNNVVRFNKVRRVLLDERQPSTAYALDVRRRNGNKQYYISTAGTTDAGAGPVGWTTNEPDGTADWHYAGANAELIVTGDKAYISGNRFESNDTELPPFHYNNDDPTDDTTYAEGAFYGINYGAGDPEGVVTAGVGSIWIRNDGTAGMYRKDSGVGNTGWTEMT